MGYQRPVAGLPITVSLVAVAGGGDIFPLTDYKLRERAWICQHNTQERSLALKSLRGSIQVLLKYLQRSMHTISLSVQLIMEQRRRKYLSQQYFWQPNSSLRLLLMIGPAGKDAKFHVYIICLSLRRNSKDNIFLLTFFMPVQLENVLTILEVHIYLIQEHFTVKLKEKYLSELSQQLSFANFCFML